ncbi:hypothetical protein H6P81_011434 [Aristolochia fimbriata]|uniref:Uncharacterized protein n=1 Tax=Aristolochia fimbriata TaxID=158543 RepID=A0AAV7ES85_ARIFI|nr:hypothetical protein H6P81_011434 [Aristolochia fimbriata]
MKERFKLSDPIQLAEDEKNKRKVIYIGLNLKEENSEPNSVFHRRKTKDFGVKTEEQKNPIQEEGKHSNLFRLLRFPGPLHRVNRRLKSFGHPHLGIKNHLRPSPLHFHPIPLRLLHHLQLHLLHPHEPFTERSNHSGQFGGRLLPPLLLHLLDFLLRVLLLPILVETPLPEPRVSGEPRKGVIDQGGPLEDVTDAPRVAGIDLDLFLLVLVGDGGGPIGARPLLHEVDAVEIRPRGGGGSALLLRPVTLPELLDLVAALRGGLARGGEAAPSGDGAGDLLPLVGPELAAVEGVPLVAVGVDEVDGLDVRPGGGEGRGGGRLSGRRAGRFAPRRRRRLRRRRGGGGGGRGGGGGTHLGGDGDERRKAVIVLGFCERRRWRAKIGVGFESGSGGGEAIEVARGGGGGGGGVGRL